MQIRNNFYFSAKSISWVILLYELCNDTVRGNTQNPEERRNETTYVVFPWSSNHKIPPFVLIGFIEFGYELYCSRSRTKCRDVNGSVNQICRQQFWALWETIKENVFLSMKDIFFL